MTSSQLPKDSSSGGPEPGINRRLILGSAGAVAALAGLGMAAWRHGGAAAPVVPVGDPTPPGFWQAQWSTPQGGSLLMASLQGKPLLLNFWATWCPPCVEELPLLDDFYLKNRDKGWNVLGLAVDKLQPVQVFLQKKPLSFPVGMAGFAGTELTRSLGNLTGSLPFSAVLGADGSILHRKMGRVSPQELAGWAGLK
jgi:thiol-disulfide isomerase/thioredoxin